MGTIPNSTRTSWDPTKPVPSGFLKGETLQPWDAAKLEDFADSNERKKLEDISFYRDKLERKTFRGVTFRNCNFARTRFERITFRRCKFTRVDLTKCVFTGCSFSECDFTNCDPYNATFEGCAVDPAQFKNCYVGDDLYNKALILFANLRRSLESSGDGRMARAAQYYYRVWDRRRLYALWRKSEAGGALPWLRSLIVAAVTGYGERPELIGAWMIMLVTVMSLVYRYAFAGFVPRPSGGFGDFWYFSLKVFCAQGFDSRFSTTGLLACQVAEFALGLVLISLFVGSVTRKLSS
jgi:hypothetical protein